MNGATAFGIGVGAGGAGLYAIERKINPGAHGGGQSHTQGSGGSTMDSTSMASPDMNITDTVDLGSGGGGVKFSGGKGQSHNCPGNGCCGQK